MRQFRAPSALFFLSVLVFAFYAAPLGSSPLILWSCLLIFYYLLLRSMAAVSVSPGVWTHIKPEALFFIFYYILFFFPYQKHLLGYYDIGANSYLTVTYPDFVNKSAILSTIGAVCFYTGTRGVSARRLTLRPARVAVDKLFAFAVLSLGITVAGYFSITELPSMLARSYIGANSGTVDQNATVDGLYFLSSHFACLAAALAVVLYHKDGKITWMATALSVFASTWAVALLVVGDRNAFFLIAIAFCGGYFTLVKSAGLARIGLMLAAALMLYQVVENTRQQENRSLTTILELKSAEAEARDSSFTITTIAAQAALAKVPTELGYFYGKFKAIGIAGIIPFSRKLFVDPSDPYLSSADLLSYATLGSVRTWSVGSNIVSDIYLDFGVLGVVILMFWLGRYVRLVRHRATGDSRSILWITIYLMTLALFAELPRYSFDFPVRSLVWTFVLYFGCAFLSRLSFKRLDRREEAA
jgi:hypothetical protein